jgi:hypothetical protein
MKLANVAFCCNATLGQEAKNNLRYGLTCDKHKLAH